MDNTKIAITGANSAVGKALLTQLAAENDLHAVAGVRRREALATLPKSPRITPAVISYEDPDSLGASLTDMDCVVHLAGILFESKSTTYQSANVDTTQALTEAAVAAGANHIVFISSLGADPSSPNGYFRSKGEAERVVADSGLAATVIRTPLLLGPDTAGGRALVRTASQPSVKVLGGGAHVLRPLDIDDLCRAILGCCRRPATGATVHDLVGPTPLTYRELLEQTATLLGHDLSVGATPVWLAKLGAALAGLFRTGGMTSAVIDVITSAEAVDRNADGDLGISLTPLPDTLAKLVPGEGDTTT
ncbi:MAG TPA: NAD(P)H-binding protein [Vicinamibacterales bacterium]|nr:NAD(P)H-binding protein [Vicinamibacterales bacterium]